MARFVIVVVSWKSRDIGCKTFPTMKPTEHIIFHNDTENSLNLKHPNQAGFQTKKQKNKSGIEL